MRLQGPQSSRALLGLGWSLSAQGRNEDALTPWSELRDRNLLDAAVQEAYLAVPFAYAELGANGQAVEFYEQALTSFAEERGRIDAALGRIHEGTLTRELVGAADMDSPQRGWFWQLQVLPDAPESRYLYPILAGNDFQEGLKNYRDLGYMGSTLAHWDENMLVYNDMIETRERAYAERTPRTDALLGSNALKNLADRRQVVAGRINDIVNHQDVEELGTPEQRAQWQRITDIEVALMMQPEDEANNALRDKLKLIKGVLYWNMRDAFPQRLYQQRRELKSLDALLATSQGRWLRVQEARRSAPTTTGDYAQRVAALQARLQALRARLDAAARAQEALLAGIAADELEAQRQRIADYEVQARFALASIYDKSAEGRACAALKRRRPPAVRHERAPRIAAVAAGAVARRWLRRGQGGQAARTHVEGPCRSARWRSARTPAFRCQCRQGDGELPRIPAAEECGSVAAGRSAASPSATCRWRAANWNAPTPRSRRWIRVAPKPFACIRSC